MDDAPRSGRPDRLNPDQKVQIARSLKRKATSSLRKTAKKIWTDHHVRVSTDTVWRVAKQQGLVYRRRTTKPLLTDAHKLARLRFATRRRPVRFWDKVMWSDEASFALYSYTKGEWVEEGEAASPHETVKWPGRIRVWAAISAKGKTPLIKIDKKMKAAQFEILLRDKCIPAMCDAIKGTSKDFVFMQDGDGTHTARRVVNFLENDGIDQLQPWPAHSPDLNPIENAWSMVERHLETVNPHTTDGLWRAMQDAWEKIDEDHLRQLCGSLPRRLEAVKAAKGGHTTY